MTNWHEIVDSEFERSLTMSDSEKYDWENFQVDHALIGDWLENVFRQTTYSQTYINDVINWMNLCDANVTDLDDAMFLFGCVGDVEGYELPNDEDLISKWLQIPNVLSSPLSSCIAMQTTTEENLFQLASSNFAGYDRYGLEATIAIIAKSQIARPETIAKLLETFTLLKWQDLRIPIFAALNPSLLVDQKSGVIDMISKSVNLRCQGRCHECELNMFDTGEYYVDDYNDIPDYLDIDSTEMRELFGLIGQQVTCQVFHSN